MAVDNNGDNHQPAGRPDGGQYAPKAGQGTDDDLATPSEVALLDAAAMLTGRREQARRDADATTGDDAWYTGKGRYLGYEYADAIVDAARHADDIPEGTTLTDMAFDDEALAEYLEDMDSDSSPDDVRSTAAHAAEGAATPPSALNASSASWRTLPSAACEPPTTGTRSIGPWVSPPPSSTRATR